MQLVLNELMKKLNSPLVTSSAFTQARKQIKHTAFIELNQKGVVEVMYEDGNYQTWRGMRVLGVDGAKVILPKNEKMVQEFGGSPQNQHSAEITPLGLASVLYDVLNKIALDSILAKGKEYEVRLAKEHLKYTTGKDLLIFDRNYANYELIATLTAQKRDFVIRCSRSSFKPVREMFAGKGDDSQIVTLKVSSRRKKEIKALKLATAIKLRLVRVMLDTGEMEVLVTSLLDEQLYPTAEFKDLYFLRWGSETFYDLLKTRLQLENFTGHTVEAVMQDFYATIYLTGLESILTAPAQDILDRKSVHNQYPQQVNQAVSFNAIKNHALQLLFFEDDEHLLLEELSELFLSKPHCVRKNRSVPRPKFSPHRSLHYHKRRKKIHF